MSVVLPVKRLKIAKGVASTQRHRLNVIDFPAVLYSLPIRRSHDPGVASVLPVDIRVVTFNCLALRHTDSDCRQIKTASPTR